MASSSVRVLAGGLRPPRLMDLGRPPPLLHLHGELPGGPAVAVVGTRWPTSEGAAYVREIAGELAAAGVAVLSGGARGIDAAAHRGALDVGGVTVVVAPCGFERPYPPEHAVLYREVIASGGAYLSVAAPDGKADLPRFLQRNELIAALAHVVIVGEAPYRSGARHTARVARRLGRILFAIPGAPWNERALGALDELRRGARLLVRARDVLDLLAEQRLYPISLPGASLLVRRSPRIGLPAGVSSSAPDAAPPAEPPGKADGDGALSSPAEPAFALTPPPADAQVARRRRRASPRSPS
ncbi:MAG: DNA-protecting protein DprA [Polyangiaceae bacterium]|nr:DNA-protecting protein DprA [Polyangiaceae bacterium]